MNSCERSSCSSSRLTVSDAEQGIAQLGGHAIDDAAGKQEVSQLRRLFLQHRRAEIARHLVMRAVEVVNAVARFGGREQRKFHAGDPAFGLRRMLAASSSLSVR